MKRLPNKPRRKKSSKRFFNNGITEQLNNTLLFLFILFLPTQFGRHFFLPFSYLSGVRVDYLAPTVYFIDGIVLLLALLNIKPLFLFSRRKKILLLLCFLFLNVLISQSLFISMYRYIRIVEVLIIGCIAYRSFLKERIVLIGFLTAGVVQLTLSILQLFSRHSVQGIFYFFGERYMNLSMPGIAKASFKGIELLRPYGTFSHPNSMAGFFLLLYVWVLIDKRFNTFLILKYVLLFVSSILVFISFSKIAILTYLLITSYYLLTAKIPCWFCKWARFIILGVISFVFMQVQTDPLTIQKRLELLKNSLSIILQHPITGVGIGNYLVAQNQYASKFSYFFNQPVHNIFLLSFAEFGLPLGIYILYLLFLVFKKLPTTHYLLLTTIFITGFFDHYWLTLQQNLFLAGFVIGVVLKGGAKAPQ